MRVTLARAQGPEHDRTSMSWLYLRPIGGFASVGQARTHLMNAAAFGRRRHPVPRRCSSVEYSPVFSLLAPGGTGATTPSVLHRIHEMGSRARG